MTAFSASPWVLGRTGRPSTLAIFHETTTARELVAAFQGHTVTYADARLMTASRKLLDFVQRVAEFSDYTHDKVNETDVLHALQRDAQLLLTETEGSP